MIDIILANFGFWLNFSIPIAIALYLLITNKEYILKEFGMQVGATLAYVAIIYSLLFATTADLMDREYWNGQATQFNYYEEWTELVHYTEEVCTGSGKDRSCRTVSKTRRDHHSPYWQVETSNGETVSISRSQYRKAAGEFGSTEKYLHRSDQVSIGDGNMFYAIPNKVIPTSVGHSYTNYITAAKQTVIKKTVSEETIAMLVKNGKLRPYPINYEGSYGEPKLDRIIDTTGTVKLRAALKDLDLISAEIGRAKQANPIIYVTDMDRTFVAALEHYWNKAKKNDIVLVVGVDTNGKIQWSDVIAWTNNTDFIVDCSNKFTDMNVNDIIPTFKELIVKGYKRKPMEEFAYLKENITLAWYWQLFIFIGNVVMSFFLTRYFLNNYDRKYGKNWR